MKTAEATIGLDKIDYLFGKKGESNEKPFTRENKKHQGQK